MMHSYIYILVLYNSYAFGIPIGKKRESEKQIGHKSCSCATMWFLFGIFERKLTLGKHQEKRTFVTMVRKTPRNQSNNNYSLKL